MKRIKFTCDAIYETEGYQKGPVYKEGSIHDFEDHFANRWLRRNVAVEVNTREPMPADDPHPEDDPDELPKLFGQNTAALLKIAEDEAVEIPEGAKYAQIRDAIQRAREIRAKA